MSLLDFILKSLLYFILSKLMLFSGRPQVLAKKLYSTLFFALVFSPLLFYHLSQVAFLAGKHLFTSFLLCSLPILLTSCTTFLFFLSCPVLTCSPLLRYYKFVNHDSLARINIALDVSSGDSDLYVNTFKPNRSQHLVLPTRENNTWRSVSYGDDTVRIDYNDAHYCYGCEYIIGVYAFFNSNYSILATSISNNKTVALQVR
jgi:hypothetical protein